MENYKNTGKYLFNNKNIKKKILSQGDDIFNGKCNIRLW